jgi:hypothetical protein
MPLPVDVDVRDLRFEVSKGGATPLLVWQPTDADGLVRVRACLPWLNAQNSPRVKVSKRSRWIVVDW